MRTPYEEDRSVLQVSEAAAVLGVNPETLRRWDNAGRFVAQRSATGQRYYNASEVARLRDERAATSEAVA